MAARTLTCNFRTLVNASVGEGLTVTLYSEQFDNTGSAVIVISADTTTTDANGDCSFSNVIPNTDGGQANRYRVTLRDSDGVEIFNSDFQMPDANSNLHDLIDAAAAASSRTPYLDANNLWTGNNTFGTTSSTTTTVFNGSITLDSVNITDIIDDDSMATATATSLSTSESIKAYADSLIAGNNELSEILANGNNTGANNIIVAAGQQITTNEINETTADAGVTVDGVELKDGLVDGRDVAVDGVKLDGVEAGATGDQSASEIKTLYESNADTNAFTDAEKAKLTGIEAGATGDQTGAEIKALYESEANTNAFTDTEKSKLSGIESGATGDQTASEIKTAYELNADTNAFTDSEKTKLSGIESGATADQSASEIRALVESATDSNVFTDADHSKLDGIEAGADVTDATNVDAAGAVMNTDASTAGMSFVINDDTMASASDTTVPTSDSVKQFVLNEITSQVRYRGGYNAATNTPDLDTSPSGIIVGDMYTVTVAGTFFTANVEIGDVLIAEQDSPTLESHWTIVNVNLDAASIKASYESNADTNAFTDAEKTKLSGIESGATADQTGAEIKSLYESEADTNAFTDAEKTKLSGIAAGAEVNDPTTLLDADIGVNVQGYSAVLAGTTASYTTAEESKLAGIEAGATADQTASEIRALVESATDSNVFTDADHSKLNGIASGAQVNDPTTLLDADIGVNVQAYSAVLAGTTASYTTAEQSKLSGIEAGATADQSNAEIEAAYNAQVGVVSQANAEAGTSTTVYRWTPQRVAQAIAANASSGFAKAELKFFGRR